MNRWTVLFVAVVISLFVAIGCSGNGGGSPVTPATGPEITSGPDLTGQAVSPTNTSVLGYFDCYFDVETQTMEVLEDRTAMYTLNIIPFLNQMTDPQYGITFGSLTVNEDDPLVIKVAVDFQFHHPFPMLEQYKCYDFMGVIVSHGDSSINYDGLWVGNQGTDTYMTNADSYTRWMNPSEFTTELIFGWAPGGIQNLIGNANLNPAKSYGLGLAPEDSLWDWLTGGTNNDGIFETAMGRVMELEFPFPPDGDGLAFGYLALACWEEQFDGPYTPYHRDEPIACKFEVTESLWYDGSDSGGNLIADISLWSWEAPPSVVKVESTVLAGSVDATGPTPGGDHVSVWSVDVAAETLTTTEGHEVWVIAECSAYGYYPITELGEVLDIPSADGALAAFFRFPLVISPEKFNTCPNIVSGVTGKTDPHSAETATYTVVATDPENDPLTYFWVVTDVGTGMPIGAYNGVQGDGAGNLDIDFSIFAVTGASYDINCDVYDPSCFTSADTLRVTIVCFTEFVSVFPNYGQQDDTGATVLIELAACEDGPDFSAEIDDGVDTIVGTALTYVDGTHFEATFDLTGATLGLYDLTVVNGCGGPSDTEIDAFEVIKAGPVLKTCGDLPGPVGTNDEHDFSVVGSDNNGFDGVYYHYSTSPTTSFQIWYYPLDYSSGGSMHCNISDPFFGNIPGLLRDDDDLRAIEVTTSGQFALSNWNLGTMTWGNYPANGPIWWGNPNGVLLNGYLYFYMQFHDIEKEFSNTGTLWGYWGNNPAGVDGATWYLNFPYGSGAVSFTGYYIADHSGSVDGLVSDNEAYWHAVDSDPEGLSSPYNRIFYYQEGPPDDYGIEIVQNVNYMVYPNSLGTIDAPYDGTGVIPVDISVVNSFGNVPSCTDGNWLCVLEDNGDGTWSFAVFNQDGDLIGRIGPYDGEPWHLDMDHENQEAHVWHDGGGTPGYCIFEFL